MASKRKVEGGPLFYRAVYAKNAVAAARQVRDTAEKCGWSNLELAQKPTKGHKPDLWNVVLKGDWKS